MSDRWIRASIGGALLLAVAGCASPRTVQAPPPMPQAPSEVMTPQPAAGYMWVPGHYAWRASDRIYVWVPGYWSVPPAGHVWVPGHWETRPDGSVWVDGRWQRT